ncbi:hypothetical protein Y1Q_0005792 [Alligator mississippiensis]|uniref:Uncharacterized protein n=1 Tax=Alligator mississippiensis TaxID=8496 RepID=A0A151MFZ4_ALLMI|nr:hypothetical protein Y1Q_0005792 [Alligator mississippiensis]
MFLTDPGTKPKTPELPASNLPTNKQPSSPGLSFLICKMEDALKPCENNLWGQLKLGPVKTGGRGGFHKEPTPAPG